MKATISFGVACLLATTTGCGDDGEPDVYGTFEATEVVVGAQTSGQIQEFVPREGMELARGAVAAIIDTIPLSLERRQMIAQRSATGARSAEAERQIGVFAAQLDVARRNYERTKRLFAQQAATAREVDQAEREYRTLLAQIEAARAHRGSVALDAGATDARVAQIDERIARSRVVNPEGGTVLTVYARAGEMVQAGQPLYKIASLDTLVLRAYLGQRQLTSVKLGQRVQVNFDRASGLESRPGIVEWISQKAEFTPTPIQTRDARADLVYAMKIRVPNEDGVLKIGMPGDVVLPAER